MSESIPAGWEVKELGSVSKLITDGSHFSPSSSPHGFPIATVENLNVRSIDISTCRKIKKEDFQALINGNCSPQKHDVLFSKDGTIGKTFVFTQNEQVVLLSSIAIIRLNKDRMNPFYCSQFLSSPLFFDVIENTKSGSAIKRIVLKDIKSIKLPVPPLPEQQKIASILTSVDTVIDKTEAQINKLKDLKKAMTQELLTKGIGHTEFKDSPVGRIPKRWEVCSLIDLSSNGINNGVFCDPNKVGSGYKLINVFDMYQGFGININKLKLLDIDENEFKRNKVHYGDVFFTRSSLKLEGIAFCNINLSTNEYLTYDGHIMKISPNPKVINSKYLVYYCLSNFARKHFMSVAKHSTMTTIGQSDIAPLGVSIPSLKEQNEVVSVLDSIQEQIDIKNTLSIKSNSMKKALMQDLLTGEVRVCP